MKIAITGGTGFLGGPLVARLVEANHTVTVLTRRPEQVRGTLPPGAQAAFFNATTPMPEGMLVGFDAVIHLAGESVSQRWTPQHKHEILRSRVEGTTQLARAIAASGTVHTFLSASATGYYGNRGEEPLLEDSAPGSDFLSEVCQAWEAATAPAKAAGIRTANIRIGVVLHPSGGALAKMLTPFKMGVGGPMGSGKQYLSWIHRDDLLALFEHVLVLADLSGPFNATAPNPVTNREFSTTLGRVLHRPAVMPAPAFALKLALGEMSQMVLEGQRVMPARALASGFTFTYPHLEAALEQLLSRELTQGPGDVQPAR